MINLRTFRGERLDARAKQTDKFSPTRWCATESSVRSASPANITSTRSCGPFTAVRRICTRSKARQRSLIYLLCIHNRETYSVHPAIEALNDRNRSVQQLSFIAEFHWLN
jgi:hypothetical protein